MGEVLTIELEQLNYHKNYSNEYADLFINQEKEAVLCQLKAEYIPIIEFRKTFEQITKLVESCNLKVFIFDKRSLTTFHQPSMEWYYTDWKVKVLRLGLKTHRKILPEEQWFRKAVEIARKDIEEKMSKEVLNSYHIIYSETISEALDF